MPKSQFWARNTSRRSQREIAATAEAMLWGIWCRSGDGETDRLFRAGVDAMQNRRLEEAEQFFGRVIERSPTFAERLNWPRTRR